jgi:hypothetical protein
LDIEAAEPQPEPDLKSDPRVDLQFTAPASISPDKMANSPAKKIFGRSSPLHNRLRHTATIQSGFPNPASPQRSPGRNLDDNFSGPNQIQSSKNCSPDESPTKRDPNNPIHKQVEADKYRYQAQKFLKGDISHYFKKSTPDLGKDWGATPPADLKRGNLEVDHKKVGFMLPNGHVIYVHENIQNDLKSMGLKTVTEVQNQTKLQNANDKFSPPKSKYQKKDKVSNQILSALKLWKSSLDGKNELLSGLIRKKLKSAMLPDGKGMISDFSGFESGGPTDVVHRTSNFMKRFQKTPSPPPHTSGSINYTSKMNHRFQQLLSPPTSPPTSPPNPNHPPNPPSPHPLPTNDMFILPPLPPFPTPTPTPTPFPTPTPYPFPFPFTPNPFPSSRRNSFTTPDPLPNTPTPIYPINAHHQKILPRKFTGIED